jgi:hypothetical protein
MGKRKYEGSLTINDATYGDLVYVLDESRQGPELITFWRKGQTGDSPGSKGGAHAFAELYIDFVRGRIVERQTFNTSGVAAISETYNTDKTFKVTTWIVKNLPAATGEPPISQAPVDVPTREEMPDEYPPELILQNKWKSDVRRSGVPYTNYEVDACVRNVVWAQDERISLQVHWEDGRYVRVQDFGRFDLYASKSDRDRVFRYLEKYDGKAARVRMILTLKGESDDWTLASATMLKRSPNI